MPSLAVNTTVLKTVPFFALFSDDELRTLIPATQHRYYSRHDFMVRAREQASTLYVILAGKAKVVIDNGEGREVTVTTIGPNEFFGEMSLIDEKPRSASVQALEPCEVLCISKSAFMSCFRNHFDAAALMLRLVVSRLREADHKIASLALLDVHGRVARLLIELAKDVNGVWVVDTGSEEIARMVGASREMVSRVLKNMIEQGVIKRDKRKIVVLDRASMQRETTGKN
jgi:CRP/FNR family cyclic AMP-dependent transcriptional regulator